MSSHDCGNELFDEYAEDYDSALNRGISVSGEDKDYFARGRLAWLAACLDQLGVRPRSFLDYGCGTGSASPFIFRILKVDSLIGVDASIKSVEIASTNHGSERSLFVPFDKYQPAEDVDIAFCNGVFHHILPEERSTAVNYIYTSLRPGGLFAFWENNPWNVGTRYVMKRIPFDRDAITISMPEAKRMLRKSKFMILRTDFLFIFPRVLERLRILEPSLSRLPIGAQYQILCQKAR